MITTERPPEFRGTCVWAMVGATSSRSAVHFSRFHQARRAVVEKDLDDLVSYLLGLTSKIGTRPSDSRRTSCAPTTPKRA